jgi:hypothetical protein
VDLSRLEAVDLGRGIWYLLIWPPEDWTEFNIVYRRPSVNRRHSQVTARITPLTRLCSFPALLITSRCHFRDVEKHELKWRWFDWYIPLISLMSSVWFGISWPLGHFAGVWRLSGR